MISAFVVAVAPDQFLKDGVLHNFSRFPCIPQVFSTISEKLEESGYDDLDLLKDATSEELTQMFDIFGMSKKPGHVFKFKKGLQQIFGQQQQTFTASKGTTETESSDILCSHKPSARGDVLNQPMLKKKESLMKQKSE